MGVPPPFEGPVGGAPRRAARPPAPPPMPIPQSPPQPQAAAAQPEQQPAPQQPQVAIPDEAAQEFLGRLNEAIDSGIVSPAQFAEGFVERVGPDMARGLVQSLTPQKLIEGISSEPGGDQTAIVTLEGRKFVDALWVETAKLVGTPT